MTAPQRTIPSTWWRRSTRRRPTPWKRQTARWPRGERGRGECGQSHGHCARRSVGRRRRIRRCRRCAHEPRRDGGSSGLDFHDRYAGARHRRHALLLQSRRKAGLRRTLSRSLRCRRRWRGCRSTAPATDGTPSQVLAATNFTVAVHDSRSATQRARSRPRRILVVGACVEGTQSTVRGR